MSNPEFAKMTERVQKLLNQAADQAGTPEGEAFEAKAMALMAQYGIDEADARAAGTAAPVQIETVTFRVTGKYVETRVLMINMMGQALHCEAVLYPAPDKRTSILKVYGMPSHLARLEFLVGALTPEMLKQVAKAKPSTYMHSGELRIYRRSWMRAYARRIALRLREGQEKAAEGHSSGALVLVDDRQKAAEKMQAEHPKLRHTISRNRSSAEGAAAGDRAGRSASIGGASLGSRAALN